MIHIISRKGRIMKDLLSQLFGLGSKESESDSVSSEHIDEIKKPPLINKKIQPITIIEIDPFLVKQKSYGYEFRQDNIDYIKKEYKKSFWKN